jgi:hypothetical protein
VGVVTERPRDVYLKTCGLIAAAFERDDFEYTPSRQRLTRHVGENADTISFQSSHDNTARVLVALSPHVRAESRRLAVWRAASSPFHGSLIGGGQVGNIAGTGWSRYNLAAIEARWVETRAIIEELRAVALPWFVLVRDPDALVDIARRSEVPGIWPDRLIDYLVYLGRSSEATSIAQGWVDAWAETRRPVVEQLRVVVEGHHLPVRIPAGESPVSVPEMPGIRFK